MKFGSEADAFWRGMAPAVPPARCRDGTCNGIQRSNRCAALVGTGKVPNTGGQFCASLFFFVSNIKREMVVVINAQKLVVVGFFVFRLVNRTCESAGDDFDFAF